MPSFIQRPSSTLLIGGSLTVALYLALFLLLQSHTLWESPTLIPDRWPNVFYPLRDLFPAEWVWAGRETSLGALNVVLYLALVALLSTTYLVVTTRIFRSRVSDIGSTRRAFRLIIAITALILLVLLFVPGTFSTDLYSYAWYGKIFALYADNPLIRVPSDYAWYDTQGWLQWVYWRDTPSAYGPVWLMLAGGIAQVGRALDNDIVTHLLGHKLLASFGHLLNVWLIWRLGGHVVRRYWERDGAPLDEGKANAARLGITLVYAWNPLVLVEFGASGHNDVLMLSCILAALVMHFKGRPRLAVLFLALACLIKAFALFFLPGYLWLLLWRGGLRATDDGRQTTDDEVAPLRERLWLVAQSLGLIGVVWVVFYIPFWDGPQSLRALTGGPAASFFIHSLGSILRFRLPEGMSGIAAYFGLEPAGSWSVEEIGRRLDWPARWGPVAITYTVFVFQTLFARTFPRMVVAWCWVLLTYLLVGAVWFWPWYVAWLIVPAALIGPGRILTATHIISITSLSLYAIAPVVARPLDKLADWTGVWVAGPPLLYLAAVFIWEKLGKGKRRGAAKTKEQNPP